MSRRVVTERRDITDCLSYWSLPSSYVSREAFDWHGVRVAFKDIPILLAKNQDRVTQQDILTSWGFDDYAMHSTRDWDTTLQFRDGGHVIVRNPVLEDQFLEKMLEFEEQQVPADITIRYHGTGPHNILSILDTGFKRGRPGCAFGSGIYFGHLAKARNYCHSYGRYGPWRNRRRFRLANSHSRCLSHRFVIETDLLLGNVFKAWAVLQGSAASMMHRNNCQSVYYSGFVNAEWVVYDPRQALPSKVMLLDE